VVDGMVQVYARTGQNTSQNGSWDEEDMNGYQLINEVGSGGTLSSLFGILSLFTEDIKISWQEDGRPGALRGNSTTRAPSSRTTRADLDVSRLNLDHVSVASRRSRGESISSSGSTAHPADMTSPPMGPTSPHHIGGAFRSTTRSRSDSSPAAQLHHGIVARATEDSTLAVIPAEAFRRVTKKFPKATSHIVQGNNSCRTDFSFSLINIFSNSDTLLTCYVQCCTQVSGANEGGPPN
jgi:lysophospholipid hydrolase